jgi:hypothetical protein
MDLVNRLIAWAAYVTGAVLIGSGAFFTFHHYRQTGTNGEPAAVQLPSGDTPGAEPRAAPSPAEPSPPVEQMYLQRVQIKRLQTLLDQKTELLQKRTALLDQKSAEHQALRSELDDAIDLLAVLAAEVAARNPSSGNGATDAHVRTDLERLREESEKSQELAAQQEGELNRLKEALGMTDEGISQLQQQAEREFAAAAADREAFEAVVSETLVRLGETAVPVLISQLGHLRADVREWAAKVLGDFGPAAKSAVPALLDALEDKDAGVRAAANRALDKIDVPRR